MVPEQTYRVWIRQRDEAHRRRARSMTVAEMRMEIAKQRVLRALRAREVVRVT